MPDLEENKKSFLHSERKSKPLHLPLMSWDIYASFFQEISSNLSDLNRLDILSEQSRWEHKMDLKEALSNDFVILVTDPKLKIVFSSQNLVQMSGYKEVEVVGKTPKIFQGELTSKITSRKIRNAVSNAEAFDEIVLNYKKDGSTYRCHIQGIPIFDFKGELMHFIAFEKVA